TQAFFVQRTGNPETYAIGCQGSGNVTCTGVSPTSVSDAATVVATYSVGAPGMGTLTVSASGANASDGGWVTVPVQSFGVARTPGRTPCWSARRPGRPSWT